MKFDYKEKLIRNQANAEARIQTVSAWRKLEEKYGVKFFLKNDTPRPVNEWLDDLYLKFSPNEIQNLIMDIMNQGDILFADLLKHKE